MRNRVASATGSRDAASAAGRRAAALAAGIALAALAWLVAQHLSHPFHLQLMEGVMQQHVERLLQGKALYPEPSPDFVPFAYNPLLYLAAVPPALLGLHPLTALRLVAVAGLGVALLVVAGWTRERTGSWWWGLVAAGLLAGSYQAMDNHLDVAQADSWLLATGLLGSWILSRSRSARGLAGGMLVLAAGFWFKQHGAWFMLGGLLYATLRERERSWPSWLVALAAGPGLYLAGNAIFGPWFHFFTWSVPAGWSSMTADVILRPLWFLAGHYPVLLAASIMLLVRPARSESAVIRIQLVAAFIMAAMGALDRGSSNNIFIPAGGWLILAGVLMLARLERRPSAAWQLGVPLLLLFSFAVRFYNPAAVRGEPGAGEAYADLVAVLRELPGPVYAPYIAELPGREITFQPAVHWVALQDLSRTDSGTRSRNTELVAGILSPALHPEGKAFILTNFRMRPGSPLAARYTEFLDFGDRFTALGYLRGRFDHGYPRYLYVSNPADGT